MATKNATARMIEVMQAFVDGEKIEISATDAADNRWFGARQPLWNWHQFDYRIAPKPNTKPSIDWGPISPKLICLAQDENRKGYLYSYPPVVRDQIDGDCRLGCWLTGKAEELIVAADIFISYKPGTCDWKDSLVYRPGYEPKAKSESDC